LKEVAEWEGWDGGEYDMRSKLTNIATNLRKRPTEAEKLLWSHLRGRQLDGLKFRRQQPIGNCVVDLVCLEKGVIVEVDGSQRVEKEKDNRRDTWLEEEGFKVLRFWDNEVLTNIDGVLEVIRENCLDHPPLAPPLKGGESELPPP
jgi:very-short-patch-repair endonuclease